MRNIRIGVVEDDPASCQLVLDYLNRYQQENGEQFTVSVFDDGARIVEKYTPVYDILLLDIEMSEMDGMAAARRIRERDDKVVIVFITAAPQYAISGYEVRALSYLLKPLPWFAFSQELKKSIDMVRRNGDDSMLIETGNGQMRLNLADILYLESIRHTIVIHTLDGKYSINGTLKDMEAKLADRHFFRSNSCYLVNLKHVTGVADQDCIMSDDERLRVSRPRKKAFLAALADYMGGGSIDNFVAMMNDEAKAVGCTGTTFVDPCGLNPNNITTARDAYLILRALTAYDVFATVAGTPTYDMGTNSRYTTPGTYILQNTDKLITNSSYHRDYTKGGKTGSLGEWQNFAGWHSQDGESYISVVLNVPMESDEGGRPALLETGTLMDWVFATYTIAPALDPTQPITEVRVAYSTQTDTVMLYPADNMMTLLPAAGGAALTEPVFNVPDELAAAIDRFLRTLPEKDCNLFLRRYWYVDSISVIADRYGMKENTVKSILFRTREKLRKFLGEEGIAV